MKIGIDARLINETGVGRYIRHLIVELINIDKKNEYILYVLNDTVFPFELPKSNWRVHYVCARWHTLREQLELPIIYYREKLDILHVPYFTVPLFYSHSIITTIHDLTILRINTGKATTLPYPLYWLKKIGYQIVLKNGLKKSKHIIAVSETTKHDVIQTWNIKNPISVTLEGVDEVFFNVSTNNELIHVPYILYVGNTYPHKNVKLLIDIAILFKKEIPVQSIAPLKIMMIGPHDYFFRKFVSEVHSKDLDDLFLFPENVTDIQLAQYFSKALITLSPSKAEGFALPLLEALAADCEILVSDIPVFRELLPSSTAFFDPDSAHDWFEKIKDVIKKGKKTPWKDAKEKQLYFQKFSWKSMAQKTLDIYNKVGELKNSFL